MPINSRRAFLRRTAAAGAGLALARFGAPAIGRPGSANERLNLGIIGTAHRAEANIEGVQSENLVALCDVDDNLLGRAGERFPAVAKFADFRQLLDHKGLDAVVISTADHTHVPAAVRAMRRGLHVYCEKPLAHNVAEARLAAETAAQAKVATQLGTQIHAGDNYRRVVELINSGAIGPVRAAHVWCGKAWAGGERPTETPEVPPNLHWDLWLGPAPERPYHPTYQPANWRRWWDFGNGTLGDMGCHYVDLPFWALDLKYPTSVAAEGPPVHPETAPPWIAVTWDFPARGDRPPVTLTWTDGDRRPDLPEAARSAAADWGSGVLFVGDDGFLLADYDRHVLLPESRFADFRAPDPTIPPSTGHYAEGIAACKTGSPTTCPFSYSGPLTETILLGNVAYRTGRPLKWDATSLTADVPEASRFLSREARTGWEM